MPIEGSLGLTRGYFIAGNKQIPTLPTENAENRNYRKNRSYRLFVYINVGEVGNFNTGPALVFTDALILTINLNVDNEL